MAYVERAHELMTSSTFAVSDKLSGKVTPNTFSVVTRVIAPRLYKVNLRLDTKSVRHDESAYFVIAERNLTKVPDCAIVPLRYVVHTLPCDTDVHFGTFWRLAHSLILVTTFCEISYLMPQKSDFLHH